MVTELGGFGAYRGGFRGIDSWSQNPDGGDRGNSFRGLWSLQAGTGSFDCVAVRFQRTTTSLRMTERRESLLGEEVVEGFYGGKFVVFNIEDGVELGDVEDVLDFLGEVEEFEFAAGVADGGEAADEFSHAGAVDVLDAGKVQDDFLFALGDEIVDGVAEVADFFAEDDASVDVEDGDVSDFAGVDLQGHDECSLRGVR